MALILEVPSRLINQPFIPIQKHIARENFYTPTYENPPIQLIDFQQVLFFAQKRKTFHKRIEFEGSQGSLDFMSIRALSVDFGIPFKQFSIDSVEISTDNASFYSLFLMSLYSEESKAAFLNDEVRLFYYRLKTSAVSPSQIDSYFWPSIEIRNLILSQFPPINFPTKSTIKNEEIIEIPFEKAFEIFEPTELLIKNGKAYINYENIYQLACQTYRSTLQNKMKTFPIHDYQSLIDSLNEEFRKVDSPKGNLTLDNLFEKCEASFPPCMYRTFKSITSTNYATFKGRFELSLFMKALGMSYYQQFEFWKAALFKSERDKWHFESQIVQLLKEIYGIDEAENEFSPHKCVTIINHDNPSHNRMIQGCPFACLSKADLKTFLKKMRRGVKHSDIDELAIDADKHPQEACKLFFNKKFIDLPLNDIEMPPIYFNESEKRLTGL